MNILPMVLTTSLLFGASANDSKSAADPIVIGVYEIIHDYDNPGAPDRHGCIPLAIQKDGAWLSWDFFSMMVMEGDKEVYLTEFSPEQDALLESLLNKPFYFCVNPEITFTPEKKVISEIIDDTYLGLEGRLKGTYDAEGKCTGIAVTNVRDICGKIRAATLSEEQEALLSKRMKESIAAIVIEREKEQDEGEARPTFDPERYAKPVFTTVVEYSLPTGWKGLWIQATVDYPKEMSPEERDLAGESPWSGYYSALIDARPGSSNHILFDTAACLGNVYGNHRYSIEGIFDVDADDNPEFAVTLSAHEFCMHGLANIKDGKWVEISSVSGSL